MIKFSLITPLRNQHDLFETLMHTLKNSTENPKEVEVLICVDDDDIPTINKTETWKEKYTFTNLEFFIVKRSEHFTRDYVNFLAKKAQGRFVMNINADSEFVTHHWDDRIYKAMDKACQSSGDEVWMGLVKDGLRRDGEDKLFPNFSCWPLVSKSSIDFLGYFLDERFKIWGPDHFIVQPYRRLNRLVSLTHVLIDHNSVHSGKRVSDGNFERFHKIDTENPFVLTEEVVMDSVDRLLACIRHQKGQHDLNIDNI